jgi:hypothetical protein
MSNSIYIHNPISSPGNPTKKIITFHMCYTIIKVALFTNDRVNPTIGFTLEASYDDQILKSHDYN